MAGLALLRLRVGLLAGALGMFASMPAFAQERVGVSSAVNPEATGTRPGGATRQLVIGQDVVFNERITTAAAGQTQLLFVDESSMTIGPNSDLTIDQFVYDPKTGTGKLAMSATRGLLRYVGGKLSKSDGAVTLRSSTATLAVRGGAFIANIEAAGKTEAIFIFGEGLTVTGTNAATETVRRPGFQITVNGPGQSPSPPAPEPPGHLAQLLQQLDGRSGGSGGAPVVPTETYVAQTGIAQTVSANISASLQQATQNTVLASSANQLNSVNPGSAQTNFNPQPNTTSQLIACAGSGTCSSGTPQFGTITNNNPPPNNPPPNNPPPTVTISYAGRVKSTIGQPPGQGFVGLSGNGDIAYSGGTLSFPQGSPQNGTFTAAVGGNVGTISLPLAPGSASLQGNSSGLGALTGTSFLSADNSFFYASLTPISQPTQRLFVFGGLPVNPSFYSQTGSTRIFAYGVQPDAALQNNIPFVPSQAGGNLPNGAVSPFYMVAPPTTAIGDTSTNAAARGLQASLAINGQGANQQSAIAVTTGTIGLQGNGQPIFTGQMRGSSLTASSGQPAGLNASVSTTVDPNGNSFYGGNAISGFVLNQAPSGAAIAPISGAAAPYGFAQPATPVAVPSGVGASRTTQALTGSFGGLMYSNAQTNPYMVTGAALVSTDAPNNRVQATLAGSPQSGSSGVSALTMQYGGLSGPAGSQAFVDNNTFAAAESAANPQQMTLNGTNTQPAGQLYFVSNGAAPAPASLLPPGASYCQCQYLQWGYWGGSLTTPNGVGSGTPRVDVGNINTWVAGTPTQISDLNSLISQSASATYNGHAIGSVFNNGASYAAAGGFTGTYNFGTQTGTMAVNNFDGRSFVAGGSGPLTGANYTFSATAPGLTGKINGTFYGPAAAETGGNFAFQSTVGPAYMASGIYAGKR